MSVYLSHVITKNVFLYLSPSLYIYRCIYIYMFIYIYIYIYRKRDTKIENPRHRLSLVARIGGPYPHYMYLLYVLVGFHIHVHLIVHSY